MFTDEFEYDETDPAGFRAGVARVGKTAGGEALAIKVFELPSGESVCPYHYEYEEEWLLVLEGEVVVRTPEGEQESGAAISCASRRDRSARTRRPTAARSRHGC